MTLDALNSLPPAEAEAVLVGCCGSRRWASQVAAARPFRSRAQLEGAADRIWWSLQPADWLEAFAAHPRIGAAVADGETGRTDWSAQEQAGAHAASSTARADLASVNAAYEARFGYIFIVCATGKTAEEMLAIARRRLENAPEAELRVAASEQAAITRLRLDKLLAA